MNHASVTRAAACSALRIDGAAALSPTISSAAAFSASASTSAWDSGSGLWVEYASAALRST